jgi:arylsulfatase A-like enzyme
VLVGKWHLDAEPWDCGFTDVRVWHPGGAGPYGENPKRRIARGNTRKAVEIKGFTNDLFGEDAAAFIKEGGAKDQPFLLWLALTAPHTPLTPNPDEITKLYEGKSDQDLWPPTLPKDAEPHRLRDYYAAVSMADRQVGTVLSALDEAKLADNTIVVFIGDNGWMLGDKALFKGEKYNGKVYPYEDSVRVPFLVRAPGNAQRTSGAAVSSLDLPPTILKAAGVTPPSEWTGRDMNGLLKDASLESTFDAAICEFPDSENSKFGDTNYRLIRTTKHKLIRWADPKRPDELFDLSADPEETKNLIDDASAKAVKDDLNARLVDWMKKTNDPALEWK